MALNHTSRTLYEQTSRTLPWAAMPWKEKSKKEARSEFVAAVMNHRSARGFSAICREFGIGRSCGYRWWERYRAEGRRGLVERERRPRSAQVLYECWWPRLRKLRAKYPTWGAAKLRVLLAAAYAGPVPAQCTLQRWLRRAGCTRRRIRRARRGPAIASPPRRLARRPNDVWTLDFKGEFSLGDGQRVRALTVRDAASRFVLAVQHVAKPDEDHVRRTMQRVFRRYGLPRAIHVDNGTPFCSGGPLGLTKLSVWWLQLGIQVSRSRRGCPQDNPSHEQMHGVLKNETAKPPALTFAAQLRRFATWRHRYNHVRPNQALGQRPPAEIYRPSPRVLPTKLPAWKYPPQSHIVRVAPNGRIWWGQAQRVIGRAFANQYLRLQPSGTASAKVWLGLHLIGTLHADDAAGLRPAFYRQT